MQNPFGDLIPGGQQTAPQGGERLVRITPEKQPEPNADLERQLLEARVRAANATAAKAESGTAGAETGDAKLMQRRANLQALQKNIDRVRELYEQNLRGGWTNKLAGNVPSIIRPENEQFNSAGAGLGETGLAAFRVPGVGAQSDAELRAFIEANKPLATDTDLAIEEKLRNLQTRLDATLSEMGQPREDGPNILPKAAGAKADTGLGPTDVTSKGGYRVEAGLSGLPDAVANMIGDGRSASDIVTFLNEQYAPYGAEVGTDLAGTIGGLVNRHKANPRAPVKSLGTGWESFSMLPSDQETSVLGSIADSTPGNIVMHAANAATAGLPAALAGNQGEAVLSASRQSKPVSSLIGDVAGSTAAMIGVNRIAGAAGRAGQTLTAGGGIGGDVLYGATRGYSEGGAEGAALGALGAGAGNLIGQTVIAPAIRAGASGIGRVTGRATPSLTGPEARASRYLPDDAAIQLDEAAASGTPMMIADTSPQMRALAGSVSRRSPEAYETAESALRPRSLGQADRAVAAIEDTLGGIENPIEASEALMATASQNARPLYEEFYAQPARSTPLLKSLLDRPAAKEALKRAREIAADEGANPETWGIDLDSDGNLKVVQDLSPETLDYVKRALDDVIETKGTKNAVTGRLELNEAGRAAAKLKKAFVREVDSLYPQYAPARAAYAGPAAAKAALEDGKRMASSRPREIERRLRNMSDAEKEQFRLGLRIGLADKVLGKRLRNDAFEPLYGSPDDRGRMSALSSEGAEAFGKRYDRERQMAETATEVLGGSPTARRQAADQAFENRIADIGEGAFAAATGAGAQGLAGKLAKGAADRYRAGFTERTAKELAPILFNDDPAAGAAFIRALMQRAERAANFRRSTSRAGAGIGAALGTSAAVQ